MVWGGGLGRDGQADRRGGLGRGLGAPSWPSPPEGVAGAFWVPAVAGPVTFGILAVVAGSEESSLAIWAALSLTGLGTGYSLGIEPSCA